MRYRRLSYKRKENIKRERKFGAVGRHFKPDVKKDF